MTIIHRRLLAVICSVLLFGAACSSGAETATAELPTLADTTEQDEAADDTEGQVAESGESTEDVSETGEADASSADDEEVDPEIAMAEYEKCMADQGLDMQFVTEGDGAMIETFDAAPEDLDDGKSISDFRFEEFEAAEEICGPILEEAFGSFEMTPEQEAEMADEMLELSRCMSDAGFDIDMTGGAFQLDENIDFEAFEEAMSTCGNAIETIGAGQ